MQHEKSDRLTVTKLNNVSKPYKQDYKSKLMIEKYSLWPINPQQLTLVQTALQRLSEKHPDFEIQLVNTIRPPEIEYIKRNYRDCKLCCLYLCKITDNHNFFFISYLFPQLTLTILLIF